MYLNIKIKEDFRTLKANQEYNFDFSEKGWDEKTLLVFDEADRGFGLKYQAGMVRMFDNFFKKYKAKSLAVSHYSLPILLTDKVYWFEKRRFVPSDLYILFETSYMFETPKLIGEKDE